MDVSKLSLDNSGFTLIEIIAALAVPRYVDLENNARQKTVDTVVTELMHGKAKLGPTTKSLQVGL